ncbi:unnamed protein product, partial [Heterosigma akashiwo]
RALAHLGGALACGQLLEALPDDAGLEEALPLVRASLQRPRGTRRSGGGSAARLL